MMQLDASAASQRDPSNSAEITIAIEEAIFCDGSECGTTVTRPDGELDLLARHWHMIEKGRSPEADLAAIRFGKQTVAEG